MKKGKKKINDKNKANEDIKESTSYDETFNKFIDTFKSEILKFENKFNDKLKNIENNINNLKKNNGINPESAKINSNEDKTSDNDKENILNENKITEFNTNVKSINKDIKDKIIQKDNNNSEIKELFLKSLNTNTIHTVNNINNDIIKYDINNPEDRIYEYTKDNDIYLYIYKYTDRNSIKRLRCYDINCNGTAKLTENGSIEIINNCNIQYSMHNYRKKEIIWYKIRHNIATLEEIKDLEFQKIYYLYRWIINPIRSHASITFEFINQYKTASKITFNNLISTPYKGKKYLGWGSYYLRAPISSLTIIIQPFKI